MRTRLVAILLLVAGAAAAQPSPAVHLSLTEAIRYGLEHQLQHRNTELQAEVRRRNTQEILGMGLPQVSAKADFTDYLELPTSLIPAEFFGGEPGSFVPVQFGTQYNTSAGITLSQLIFDGRYLLGLKAAQMVQELANKEITRSRIDLIENITKAYLTALLTQQRMAQVEANVRNLQELLRNTEALHQVGFVESLDVDRIRYSHNNLLTEQKKLNSLMAYTLDLLKFQMGMPVDQTVVLSDSLREPDLQPIVLAARPDPQQRIEYRMLQDNLRLAEMNIKRYRAGYWPALYGAASFMVQSQENRFSDIASGTWYDFGLVGLTLNIPVFDGLAKARQIQGAKLELMQVENNLKLFENSLNLEVRSALRNLEDALYTLELNRESLDLAEKVMRNSRIKFEQQVGSSLEVTEAETSLKNAQVAYSFSLYEVWLAKLQLEKALGLLDKNFN